MYDRSERSANGIGAAPMRDHPVDQYVTPTKLGRVNDEGRIRTEDVVTSLQNLHSLIREVHNSACGYGPEINAAKDTVEPNGRFEQIHMMNQYCIRMINECTEWINNINYKAP